jgi:hypothetical protein
MKKIISTILVIALLASTLMLVVSCGGGGKATPKAGIINGGVTWVDPNGAVGTAGNIVLGGVNIAVWDANDKKVYTSVSQSDGIFNIQGVEPGTYTVTGCASTSAVQSTEKRWITKNVVVKSEKVTAVNFDYQNSVGTNLPEKYVTN